ncbi:MAG: tRNA 2-selenouridine(34) synthase MnmH [Luminiphilus sp.]|nr:tRNA 2-selenouridine(34) synthase MnmH [Luminiphilus sp.]
MSRLDSSTFEQLFLEDRPLIDTRAPIEFQRGSFPSAVNIPLMTDDEREQVGICYKEQGEQAAVALGHKLVSDTTKEERIAAWIEQVKRQEHAALFCFRGGLRSQTVQSWLATSGYQVPVVNGGYKALRSYLLASLEECVSQLNLIVIGGRTGVAKTALLNQAYDTLSCPVVDLEGLAHHRGSAFGKRAESQPTQINFENHIAIELLKLRACGHQQMIMEDESRLIGRCALPLTLQEKLREAPLVILEASLEDRVHHSWENYILSNYREQVALCNSDEVAFTAFADSLKLSLGNIRKRLGGARHQELAKVLEAALLAHQQGDPEPHKQWIEVLLRDYYDPMYDYQLKSKQRHVVFRGNFTEVLEFLSQSINPAE